MGSRIAKKAVVFIGPRGRAGSEQQDDSATYASTASRQRDGGACLSRATTHTVRMNKVQKRRLPAGAPAGSFTRRHPCGEAVRDGLRQRRGRPVGRRVHEASRQLPIFRPASIPAGSQEEAKLKRRNGNRPLAAALRTCVACSHSADLRCAPAMLRVRTRSTCCCRPTCIGLRTLRSSTACTRRLAVFEHVLADLPVRGGAPGRVCQRPYQILYPGRGGRKRGPQRRPGRQQVVRL